MARAFQVKMIKDEEGKTATVIGSTFEDKTDYIAKHIHKVVKSVTIGVFGYVLLDTARKVVISKSSQGAS
jgi:hypothetical protein